jgi:hypothetical protein
MKRNGYGEKPCQRLTGDWKAKLPSTLERPKNAASRGKAAEIALPRDRLFKTTNINSEGKDESGWKRVIRFFFKPVIPFISNH